MTISEMRADLMSVLDAKASLYGEYDELAQTELNSVSAGIDEVNETNNPNLPQRPT